MRLNVWLATSLLVCAVDVHAQSDCAVLTWQHPTQNTDGSALPLDGILNTGIYSFQSSDPDDIGASPNMVVVPAPATEVEICGFSAGEWFFGAKTVDVNGQVSDLSNVASKVFASPRPLPPAGLAVVEGQQTAYTLTQSADRIALVPVGTVPPGVECDGEQSVTDGNGVLAYVVPRDAVQWAGSVQSQVVFARCSAA